MNIKTAVTIPTPARPTDLGSIEYTQQITQGPDVGVNVTWIAGPTAVWLKANNGNGVKMPDGTSLQTSPDGGVTITIPPSETGR